MKKTIQTLAIFPISLLTIFGSGGNRNTTFLAPTKHVIAQRQMSLETRYGNKFVNDVFKDNILLNLAYLDGRVTKASDIKWDEVTKPFTSEFKLEPNQTFAYHADTKANYNSTLVKTTNAHFNSTDGFKSDGYLFGDGVCHLASLINWAAKDAGLSVEAPTNHNFANIPEVPKEYGVSIYDNPYSKAESAQQNLYITNNKSKPVAFKFEYNSKSELKVSVIELN